MLTARGEEVDRVVGLEIGADDYLPKPFSPRELLARIRAVLRRHAASPEPDAQVRTVGGLVIDRDRRIADFQGVRLELTAYQFDLLWVLAGGAGRVMARANLHNKVRELRGEPATEFDPAVDRSIDVHLSKIRGALAGAHPDGAALIQTIRGVGYVLGPEA
jgi:DNA-binding response OmpR family regulator